MKISLPSHRLSIRPITPADLPAALEVYRQCEDFIALGPVATVSMEMVLKDIEISKGENGIFCGIFKAAEQMIGVLDVTLSGYHGNPQAAYIGLLMLAQAQRSRGLGAAIMQAVEAEIQKDPQVTQIHLGAQANNPLAVRFWQRQGYRIVSGPDLYPDGTSAYSFRKDLHLSAEVCQAQQISLTRLLGAPRHRVYPLFTTAQGWVQWCCEQADCHATPGGALHIYTEGYHAYGEFRTLEAPGLVSFTWDGDREPPMLIQVTLAEEDPGTRLTFLVNGMCTRAEWDGIAGFLERVWGRALDHLKTVVDG